MCSRFHLSARARQTCFWRQWLPACRLLRVRLVVFRKSSLTSSKRCWSARGTRGHSPTRSRVSLPIGVWRRHYHEPRVVSPPPGFLTSNARARSLSFIGMFIRIGNPCTAQSGAKHYSGDQRLGRVDEFLIPG